MHSSLCNNNNCYSLNKNKNLILYNAKIHSMQTENRVYEALEIKNDKISRVGSNNEILQNKKPGSIIIDLKGHMVIPGLIDTHTHFFAAALSELKETLANPSTIQELLNYIKEKTEILGKGKWIYIGNVYPLRLSEKRFPTIEELDKVSPDNPVFIDAAYASQVNSKALQISKLNEKSIISTGRLCKDKVTGKLNGMLLGCGELIKKYIPFPQYTKQEMVKAFLVLQEKYLKLGITSIVEAFTTENAIDLYNEMYENGILHIRTVYTKVPNNTNTYNSEEFENYFKSVKIPSKWGKPGFIKLFLDGGFLTGTAYMKKSFSRGYKFLDTDENFRGIINYNKDELIYWIEKALENNLQMTAHCTGDASLEVLLSAYEEVNKRQSINGKRFTVIHGNFVNKEALLKIKSLGIILISQPAWHYMDSLALSEIMDKETMATFLPYKDILNAEVIATGGSDHMIKHDSIESVNPYNPFIGIYNLVTRHEKSGVEILGEQRISPFEAMKMYTANAAYLTFDEDKKGTLEEGKLADLVVLSKDITTCSCDKIKTIVSKMTIVDGKIVYNSYIPCNI